MIKKDKGMDSKKDVVILFLETGLIYFCRYSMNIYIWKKFMCT